jgi:GT2 family glycosyltransferase
VWVFFGGPVHLGSAINGFGGAGMLIRKEALQAVGGFHEFAGVGHEDWQLFAKLALAGRTIAAVPDPNYLYRISPQSMIRTTSRYHNTEVVNSAYRDALSSDMALAPLLMRGLHERVAQLSEANGQLHAQIHQMHVELDRRDRYLTLLRTGRDAHAG